MSLSSSSCLPATTTITRPPPRAKSSPGPDNVDDNGDGGMTCPVCQWIHGPQGYEPDNDNNNHNNNNQTTINNNNNNKVQPSHGSRFQCSHGARAMYLGGQPSNHSNNNNNHPPAWTCPVCRQVPTKQPVLVLPCGHVLCQDDFQRLGGHHQAQHQLNVHKNPLGTTTRTTTTTTTTSRRENNEPQPLQQPHHHHICE